MAKGRAFTARDAFNASLGQCITAWAHVEQRLFDLFQSALWADEEQCALLFWKFPSFSMRLSYTSMLVEHCLRTDDGKKTEAQKYWKKLKGDLDALYSERNKLAHPQVLQVMTPGDDDSYVVKRMIIPNKNDPHRKAFKPIEFADLVAHKNEVFKIQQRLSYFVDQFSSFGVSACQASEDEE